MSKLYSSRQIVSSLERLGFRHISQKGSHAKFKNNKGRITIVPMDKKEVPIGTFRSILRQADITIEKFKENL